jgi:hypothetical protein
MATRVQAGHFSSSRLSPGALQIARDCAANVAVTGVRGGEGGGGGGGRRGFMRSRAITLPGENCNLRKDDERVRYGA